MPKAREPGVAGSAHPLFSIITVTLNPGALLDETVASVRTQTFASYEHVVKDGGSSDGSFERARMVPGVRCTQLADSGIYDAMNQAIGLCRGDYVLFLNAGDTLAGPHTLEELARAARSGPDLMYSDYWHHDLGSVVVNPRSLSRFFLFRNTICHQAWLIRRDVLARVGMFDTSLRVAADHELLTRALLHHGATSQHTGVVAVHYRGGGFSAANRPLLRRDFIAIRKRYFRSFEAAFYTCVLALSARPLRSWLLTSRRTAFLRPIYVSLRNAAYRVGSKRRSRADHT